MDTRCALCRAIQDTSSVDGRPKLENTKLFETDRFVVMPCIGPLCPGHVLIVSREHSMNLASTGRDGMADYDDLASKLMPRFHHFASDILEGEHGSTVNDKAGACVAHTHVHWIPGLARFDRMLDFDLTVLRSGVRLDELADLQQPYIFLRGGWRRPWVAYDARGLRSQMIRRTLCDSLGRDDTNWKAAPRYDWIQETVDKWLEIQN